ncbi:MAG: twin-arginine translocase subunit TatC [Gemmatimonadales bacterium]|jgi:sec-independent protein translocase protein TatC
MERTESGEMPFLDHLEELRQRIIRSLAALVAGGVIAFVVVMNVNVLGFLAQPILPYLHGRKLVYTHPADPFSIVMTAALGIGIIFALPVILYQIWSFLSPALYKHERRIALWVLGSGTGLFVLGAALAYFLILPMTLKFLIGMQPASMEPMITASEYFGFTIMMMLVFGAVFELPLVIVALAALGLVTPKMLRGTRRAAIVTCVAGACIITPGDLVVTSAALAVPMYLLYEASILVSSIVYRRRGRAAEREAEALDPAPAPATPEDA